jgi:hypothetical protein
MWIRFNNILFLQLFMLFSTRVLEFLIMETTNIYEILHLLSLIKIKPNMDFGGGIWHLHIYAIIQFFFSFLFQREWRKVHIDGPN